jgi:hypothetical protein
MESSIANEQHFGDGLPPTEPHFDDEATLLSAQPVVPLERIKRGERWGKRLAFGMTIVFSLIAGAIGGNFIYRQRAQKAPAAINTAMPGADGGTMEEPAASPSLAEHSGDVDTGIVSESGTAVTVKEPVHAVAPSAVVSPLLKKRAPRDHSIVAQRSIRRTEREVPREARRQKSKSDDVLRIREIFEGSGRP